MANKCDIIANTPRLRDTIGSYQFFETVEGACLRSDHYSAVGCDLADIAKLERLVADEVDTSTSLILCTAEVSITYMNIEAADALIKWAARYEDSKSNSVSASIRGNVDAPQFDSVFSSSFSPAVPNILSPRR